MKINGGISIGNIITIAAMLITIAIAYGSMDNRMSTVNKDLNKKADKELINYKIEVIMNDIAEIKQLLKRRK
tara:strand:+ start:2042 stop:2257 length:216 start_codon:yes stop_codon:yes gene_type:complete